MDDRLARAGALLSLSEEACADLLRNVRYAGPHPPCCPRCGSSRFRRLPNRPRVDRCLGCGADVSVTAGTALHGLKGPLGRVLAALLLLTRPGSVSTRALARLFGVQWKSAAAIVHKLRVALAHEPPVIRPADARVVWGAVRLRWEPGKRPKNQWQARNARPYLRTVAVSDTASGRFVIDVTRSDDELTARRLLDATAVGADRVPWARTGELHHVSALLARTHRQVSARWIRVYVHAIAAFWGITEDEALGAVVRAPPRTTLQIRPVGALERERTPTAA